MDAWPTRRTLNVLFRRQAASCYGKLQAASNKPQASNKLQATSRKQQAANNFSFIKFPVSSNERLYKMYVPQDVAHETQFDVVRSVFYYCVYFHSTVKKCWCLLYPSKSGSPGTAKFSILQYIVGVFFFNSSHNFLSVST